MDGKNPCQILLECSDTISKGFWDASRAMETWLISFILLLAEGNGEKGLDWNCQAAQENDKSAMQKLDTAGHSV